MYQRVRKGLGFAALAALVALAAVPAWSAEVLVYQQNPDFQALYASQNDTANMGFGPFATAFDNFSLGSATTINMVEWVGGYYNPQSQGAISGWTVTFWSDNSGVPFLPLATFMMAGTGGETFLQNDALGDPTYMYTAAVNFNAAAGTMYWLSVVPDVPFPPQWGWTSSVDGDGVAYQVLFGLGGPISTDLAFNLYMQQQTGVPEPSSLMLLGTGLVGVAGFVRRKLKA